MYYLLNEITNKCYNITDIGDIEEYYLNDDETIYYSCRNIKYNSFPNCKECSGNNTCSLCAEDFSFITFFTFGKIINNINYFPFHSQKGQLTNNAFSIIQINKIAI